jgi:hypothetical protein
MKVLVIPENPKYDRYIIQPVIERLMADLAGTYHVEVLLDPHLNGVDEALVRRRLSADPGRDDGTRRDSASAYALEGRAARRT